MAEKLPSGFESLATGRAYFTQESMLAVETRKRKLFIGLPKETSLQENRLGLTPEAVVHLVNEGHEIVLESGAGEPSKYSTTIIPKPGPPSPIRRRKFTRPTLS